MHHSQTAVTVSSLTAALSLNGGALVLGTAGLRRLSRRARHRARSGLPFPGLWVLGVCGRRVAGGRSRLATFRDGSGDGGLPVGRRKAAAGGDLEGEASDVRGSRSLKTSASDDRTENSRTLVRDPNRASAQHARLEPLDVPAPSGAATPLRHPTPPRLRDQRGLHHRRSKNPLLAERPQAPCRGRA